MSIGNGALGQYLLYVVLTWPATAQSSSSPSRASSTAAPLQAGPPHILRSSRVDNQNIWAVVFFSEDDVLAYSGRSCHVGQHFPLQNKLGMNSKTEHSYDKYLIQHCWLHLLLEYLTKEVQQVQLHFKFAYKSTI